VYEEAALDFEGGFFAFIFHFLGVIFMPSPCLPYMVLVMIWS
jgi:hypothetical protein